MTNYTVIQGSFHELEWTAVWICCTAHAAHRQVMPGFAHSIMLVCLSDKFSNNYNVPRLIILWPNNTLFRAYLFSNHFKGLTWVQKRNLTCTTIKSCIIDPVCSPYWTWWIQTHYIGSFSIINQCVQCTTSTMQLNGALESYKKLEKSWSRFIKSSIKLWFVGQNLNCEHLTGNLTALLKDIFSKIQLRPISRS